MSEETTQAAVASDTAEPAVEETEQSQSSQDTPVSEQTEEKKTSKHKLKIGEEEREVELEELITLAQKGIGSNKKFEEAATMMRQIEAFKKDPRNALKEAGVDYVKLAEDWLQEQINLDSMSDEQREAMELKKERDKLKEELENERKGKEEQARAAEELKAAQEIDKDISAALSDASIKPSPRMVARMAETMLAALNANGRMMPAKDALQKVRDDFTQEIAEYVGSLDAETLQQVLPKGAQEALRKAQIEKVKSASPIATMSKEPTQATASKSKKAMSTDDFFNKLEGKFNKQRRA